MYVSGYPPIICLAAAIPSSAVIAGTTVMSKTSPHSVVIAMIGAMVSASKMAMTVGSSV